MKRAYVGFSVALAAALVVWLLRDTRNNSGAEKDSATTPSSAPYQEFAQTPTAAVPEYAKATIQTNQQVIELKRKYPRLTEEEIASALRQGIRLERLEQAPPGAVDLKMVTTAFAQFKKAFGAYPQGDNIEMAKALLGENPKRTVFLDNYKERFTDSSGALADAWKTPLLIEVKAGDQISIRSAGPDRVFWNADDVLLH